MKCGDTMKFKLVEDIDILIESKIYRIDYKTNSGRKDYAYIIGNDKPNIISPKHLLDNLQQKQNNKEKVTSGAIDLVQKMNSIISIQPLDLNNKQDNIEYQKALQKKTKKFLNTTHSSSRDKSSLGPDFITHHLDGVEENDDNYNLLGIPKNNYGEHVHWLLHQTRFSKHYKKGSTVFPIILYDGTRFVRKVLKVNVEV